MQDCLNLLGGPFAVQAGFDAQYCTKSSPGGKSYCYADPADTSKCAADQSNDPGSGLVQMANYWVLASANECAFVLATKGGALDGGLPDKTVCVSGAQLRQFVKYAADGPFGCHGNHTVALQASPETSDTTWCLVDKNNAGVCGA